jgi:hypothetical protein
MIVPLFLLVTLAQFVDGQVVNAGRILPSLIAQELLAGQSLMLLESQHHLGQMNIF